MYFLDNYGMKEIMDNEITTQIETIELALVKDSVPGRIMARGFGYRDDAAQQVQLACLLANGSPTSSLENRFAPSLAGMI
jgi:hypothetical protein